MSGFIKEKRESTMGIVGLLVFNLKDKPYNKEWNFSLYSIDRRLNNIAISIVEIPIIDKLAM